MTETMTIASWNVNSILARLPRIAAFCKRVQPDVVCLQELKCDDAKFPAEDIKAMGYTPFFFGQKRYNGVAILVKTCSHGSPHRWLQRVQKTQKNWDSCPLPEHARYLAIEFNGITIASIYAPNGGEYQSPPFAQKISWFQSLIENLQQNPPPTPLVIAGDLNIAPEDLDVYDPEVFVDTTHVSPEERQVFSSLIATGMTDSFRHLHSDTSAFSWWDYRALGFPLNRGLRIDFILTSVNLADHLQAAWIERDERKGIKPSDHAPCICQILI